MKLNATYIKIRDKWWGLPLFLPSLILPIFAHINTFAHISSGEVFLFYLPLALMISMMMFFSWAALPGITLGIFVRKYAEYSAAIFLIPICISFDTAEKRRYATYLILNRRFSFAF